MNNNCYAFKAINEETEESIDNADFERYQKVSAVEKAMSELAGLVDGDNGRIKSLTVRNDNHGINVSVIRETKVYLAKH